MPEFLVSPGLVSPGGALPRVDSHVGISIAAYIDQFGFKNIISLHLPYLGGFQEHDKR